jgi:TolA-binding protein
MARLWICLLVLLSAVLPAFGLTAEEQMRFADGIYLRGLYETAVGEYLVFLRDYPGHDQTPAVLYRTGECYRQMGNQAGAERFYKRVADEHPDSPQTARAVLRRAEFALADGRTDEARSLLKGLLKAKPPAETAAAASYYLGLAHQKAGDAQEASAAFSDVLKKHGDSPHAAYAALELAALHAADRKNDDQMTAWFETAVQTATTPSAKAEALFRWGDWAYRQGRYQLAADTLQSLLVELPGERRARDAWLASAWSLYYLDRTAEAMEAAERLAADAADPETAASGTYLRANCLRKMNRDGEALQQYETVVRDYPTTSFARRAAYEIMVTHFKRGDAAKTLAAMPPQPEAAHEADVLWMRAESERMLERTDLARGRYEALVDQFPKSSQAPAALLRLGEMAREAGRLAEAADFFQRIATDYPKNEAVPDALKAAALARLRAGDPEGALAEWDALLGRKLDADVAAEARLQKALVLIELQRGDEAMAALEALLKDRPEAMPSAQAHYWRGVLLSDREQWEAAETALRSSLAAGADAQTASLARLRLAVVLQRLNRMDEAADQIRPLLAEPGRVAENPALVEWLVRRRFDQGGIRPGPGSRDGLGHPCRRGLLAPNRLVLGGGKPRPVGRRETSGGRL